MAKKKDPSLEDAINIFEDAMNRSSLSTYLHVNRIIISKNPNGQSIIIVPEENLWLGLLEKEEFKSHLKELDLSNSIDQDISKKCIYGEDLNNESWIDLNNELLYSGKLIKLKIDNLEYELSVNKNLIPLKLKKAEYNNISYRVFPDMALAIKKKFEYPLENHGFTMMRIFQIV